MTIFFTADHHFGHTNIIKYANRPFDNVDEMDYVMIERWNQLVRHGDLIFYLGDFTLGDYELLEHYFSQLRGKIRVIPGGHDFRWIAQYANSTDRLKVLGKLEIAETLLPKKNNYSVPITMCHYPMLSWERSHYGAPHLHGHTHGTIGVVSFSGDIQLPPGQKVGKRLDVGVDTHDFYPYSLEEVKELLL